MYMGSVYYGEYRTWAIMPRTAIPTNVTQHRQMWGAEARLVSTAWSGQKIVGVLETRQDVERNLFNYDDVPYASIWISIQRNAPMQCICRMNYPERTADPQCRRPLRP